jgi:hypothetical protein
MPKVPLADDTIAEITRRAVEISRVAPAHLQEAAFNRAFEALSKEGDGSPRPTKRRAGGSARRGRNSNASPSTGADDPAGVLIASLNRTDHPGITEAPRVLERALHLLQVAERDHEIPGLSAPQIAKVLTDKFRLSVTRQAVSYALDNAGRLVDRTPQAGASVLYRIMDPGEKHLKSPGDAGKATGRKGSGRKPAKTKSRATKSQPAGKGSPEADTTGHSKAPRKRSGRGPKGLIEELVDDGFFSSPKLIGDIQEQLRHKKGVQMKPTDLSPALVRLLRQGTLDRDRNKDNKQYEYRTIA